MIRNDFWKVSTLKFKNSKLEKNSIENELTEIVEAQSPSEFFYTQMSVHRRLFIGDVALPGYTHT